METPQASENAEAALAVQKEAEGRTLALLGLLVVQVFFGSFAVAGKIAFRGFDPLAFATLRVTAAAVLFWMLHRMFVRERVAREDLGRLAVYSFFGIVVNQVLFVLGLERTDPVAATVLVTTIPVFTLLIAVLLKVERIGWRKIAGIGLAFAGVIVLVGFSRAAFSGGTALGNLFVTLNALSYAIYLVIARDMLRRYNALTVAAWTFTFGALAMLPIGAWGLVHTDWGAVPGASWGALVYVILFATLATYFLNNWALGRVASSTVAVFVYLQPAVSAVLAYYILDIVPTQRTLIGALLIFAGVYFAAVSRKSGRLPMFGRVRV